MEPKMIKIDYISEGLVTARGCSTKDKIFHVECENHVMGTKSEKFCYCSYPLCNQATTKSIHRLVLLVILIPHLLNWT